jgi:hypothetical protein
MLPASSVAYVKKGYGLLLDDHHKIPDLFQGKIKIMGKFPIRTNLNLTNLRFNDIL